MCDHRDNNEQQINAIKLCQQNHLKDKNPIKPYPFDKLLISSQPTLTIALTLFFVVPSTRYKQYTTTAGIYIKISANKTDNT